MNAKNKKKIEEAILDATPRINKIKRMCSGEIDVAVELRAMLGKPYTECADDEVAKILSLIKDLETGLYPI